MNCLRFMDIVAFRVGLTVSLQHILAVAMRLAANMMPCREISSSAHWAIRSLVSSSVSQPLRNRDLLGLERSGFSQLSITLFLVGMKWFTTEFIMGNRSPK